MSVTYSIGTTDLTATEPKRNLGIVIKLNSVSAS